MKQVKKWISVLMVVILTLGSVMLSPAVARAGESGYGLAAWDYLNTINKSFPGRGAGNNSAWACGDWIIGLMQSWGYQPQIHNFTGASGQACRNLIFVKPGQSDKEIVIGAHYDSDPITKGADDNGSGVSVVLETAQRIANKSLPLPCTIRIIFWDDEEEGMIGSLKYLQTYGIGKAMCIINLDSIAAGDKRYVHGGGGAGGAASTWLRDAALQISEENGLGLTTHSGLPGIPAGTRVQGSDQMHWTYQGIPYIYCEASLYDETRGNEKPYRVETADGRVPEGQIMHTQFDDLAKITDLFGGRTQGHLAAYSQMCYELLTRLQSNGTLNNKTQPAEQLKVLKAEAIDISPSGYTVKVTLNNGSLCKKVMMPTWTSKNGQDDLIWHQATLSGNTATFRVNTKDHKNESGVYHTHVYYDSNIAACTSPVAVDVTVPAGTSEPLKVLEAEAIDISPSGYTVKVTLNDGSLCKKVMMPTWTSHNGQDDLIWHQATLSGNTATFRVNTKDHKNESGVYHTHVYYDSNIAACTSPVAVDVTVPAGTSEPLKVLKAEAIDISPSGYTVKVTFNDGALCQKVSTASWSHRNGQDDLLWELADLTGNTATYRVSTRAHKGDRGWYSTHLYIYRLDGSYLSPVPVDVYMG
ncbi:M20/M25/M40 family metallo-hydrolase [Cuneatibacter caecimuris]|uniref:GBS Bsp-like repeat-containing protein n=1 Tax=Cuneatibacter caecimuris TaxID=1796618 RepID=A0A4Q7PM35_9FIRM|nr:M20/M25/M40 family metallo-hydrolase [Cuneatibacter caecimuris]RZT01188.1 GBS Bsp-like repeat-containing protein [Cuneatibacter caecimuris]